MDAHKEQHTLRRTLLIMSLREAPVTLLLTWVTKVMPYTELNHTVDCTEDEALCIEWRCTHIRVYCSRRSYGWRHSSCALITTQHAHWLLNMSPDWDQGEDSEDENQE